MKRILWAASAVLALTTTGRVEASVDITIEQVGSNVVLTGSGSLNITGLSFAGTFTVGSGVGGAGALAFVGPTFATVDDYSGLTGPSSFGSGVFTFASSGSGDLFGAYYEASGSILEVPKGYVSGSILSGTATFAHKTLSELGLTNGTYTFNLPNDSLTVQIGPAATAVPEPSTAIVAAFGAAAFITYGWSRRSREQRRQAAA